ncbi:MAG: hypothetical protein PWQ65_805 [Bacteroidota bacterium]|nr:hypothetical protein [Bacteroidota bacterium]
MIHCKTILPDISSPDMSYLPELMNFLNLIWHRTLIGLPIPYC